VRALAPALEQINRMASENGNGQHSSHTPPANESNWAYGGIDTARDHKMLGEAIGRFQLEILELKAVVVEFPAAIVRLEGKFENRFIHLEVALSQMQQRRAA
jgi:hypothetical protein